jgi:hypothetical protein
MLMMAANGVTCSLPVLRRLEYELNPTERRVTLFYYGGRQAGRPEIATFGDTNVGVVPAPYTVHEEEQFAMRSTSTPPEALLAWGESLPRSGREKVDLNF